MSVLFLNSFRVQLTAEASFLSFITVLGTYILIGVSLAPFHVSVRFDKMLYSGMYDGIGETSHRMSGGCFKVPRTSTWSVQWFSACSSLNPTVRLPPVLPFCIRSSASHGWYTRCPVGSQGNCNDWTILHGTRHRPANWGTWSCTDHPRSSLPLSSLGPSATDAHLDQVLAVHTFVAAMWRVGLQARGFAFCLVGIVCIFIALWVSIGASIHRNYETPTPVRFFNPSFRILFLPLTPSA
jgi:hypothetical protein